MDTEAPDAPAALADLIAAGLVSHEMIGDPARLGGEAAALAALCRLIAGPVWRVGPYHYAFRAGPDDLQGALGPLGPGERAEALATALAATLGPDAAWLAPLEAPAGGIAPEAPLVLLRAQAAAVEAALAPAEPGIHAIINARFAADCARLAAGAEPGTALDARLAALEAGQAEIRAAQAQAMAVLDGLAEAVAALAAADRSGDPAGFTETLGLTLAEFLARLERGAGAGAAPAPARVPQLG